MRLVKAISVALVMTCAVAALVAGCRHAAKAVTAPRFGDPASLVSQVTVSSTEFRAGDEVRIEVAVHNPTSMRIAVHFTSGCTIMFAVKTPDGTIVAPVGFACTQDTPTIEFEPGETHAGHFVWTGTTGSPEGTPLPPGEYEVIGGFDPDVLRNASTPVAIKILAK